MTVKVCLLSTYQSDKNICTLENVSKYIVFDTQNILVIWYGDCNIMYFPLDKIRWIEVNNVPIEKWKSQGGIII